MLRFISKREFNFDVRFHGFWDPSLEPGRRVERRPERRPERRSEPRGDPELEVPSGNCPGASSFISEGSKLGTGPLFFRLCVENDDFS